jgi:hypothetical protein
MMELVLKELNVQTPSRYEPKDNITPPTEFHPGRTLPPITSLFDNDVWFRVEGQLSVQLESDGSAMKFSGDHHMDRQYPGFSREKNRLVCQALLVAIPPYEKVQEAGKKREDIWKFFINDHLPTSHQGLTFPQFAAQVEEHEDAIGIAKVLLLVATVMDVQSHERLLLLVDRLIIWDDVYMATLDGIECALLQGILFADIGQARRSW